MLACAPDSARIQGRRAPEEGGPGLWCWADALAPGPLQEWARGALPVTVAGEGPIIRELRRLGALVVAPRPGALRSLDSSGPLDCEAARIARAWLANERIRLEGALARASGGPPGPIEQLLSINRCRRALVALRQELHAAPPARVPAHMARVTALVSRVEWMHLGTPRYDPAAYGLPADPADYGLPADPAGSGLPSGADGPGASQVARIEREARAARKALAARYWAEAEKEA